MRRLPVYVLLDCSESMIGAGLAGMRVGINSMLKALRQNPHALETAWISFITFDSRAELKSPLQSIDEAQPPRLLVRPGTSLGSALMLLAERILKEVQRNQSGGAKGDFRPIVILITDGQPTDDWRSALRDLNSTVKIANFYAIGCGDDIDFAGLREMTDVVLNLHQTDEHGWAKLFVWISDTVSTASRGVSDGDEREVMLSKLPDVIEKVDDSNMPYSSDDGRARQLFLSALCGKTKQPYLMRYRWEPDYGVYVPAASHIMDAETCDFSTRAGAGLPQVNSREVDGCPPCAYCGNMSAGSCGNCGTVFCGSSRQPDGTSVCPGCGGILRSGGGGRDFKIKASEG
ncbi:VWA domain-containing protein [Roseimicrobium gellanilyticum]|nr:VWA domain-containing protein [Roseimicrobium gellanilyticum]